MLTELTKKQSDFAGENYGIVDEFLRDKSLPYDEYHDVVILNYLKAAQDYLEKEGLQEKYKFKTVAYRSMLSALIDHYRANNRLKRKADVISLEEIANNPEYLSAIADSGKDVAKTVVNQQTCQQVSSALTEKQLQTVELKAQGYTYREIAEQCGITVSGVSSRLYRIKNLANLAAAA